jgi:hypothetical protein
MQVGSETVSQSALIIAICSKGNSSGKWKRQKKVSRERKDTGNRFYASMRIKDKRSVCFNCRQAGHAVKDCPEGKARESGLGVCFNCGEDSHSIHDCPNPKLGSGAKFAVCFICAEKGHLSRDCPRSNHGVYPNGGSCRICGEVTHLRRDCPNVKEMQRKKQRDARERVLAQKIAKQAQGEELDGNALIEPVIVESNNQKRSRSFNQHKRQHN